MEPKFFCVDSSKLYELDAKDRGYRSDIYVEIDNAFFHLHVYDIVRLKQDFETEIEYHNFFRIEPNIVIVQEVTWRNIKLTIEKLFKGKYFDNIKPIYKDLLKELKLFNVL